MFDNFSRKDLLNLIKDTILNDTNDKQLHELIKLLLNDYNLSTDIPIKTNFYFTFNANIPICVITKRRIPLDYGKTKLEDNLFIYFEPHVQYFRSSYKPHITLRWDF